MNGWQSLSTELDAWRTSGQRATLWCRDDDACRDSAALQRLLELARAYHVPVALAVIPAALEPSLADTIAQSAFASVVQHGYAHRNYASPGERNWELGANRPVAVTIAELVQGRGGLEHAFGERFCAVLVPPWNRIDPDVIAQLAEAGFHGLSTFGPRSARCAAPGITQCNAHVDLVAWRKGRGFIGVETALERLVAHLQARREGPMVGSEPSGILTHHLDLDDAAWEFLDELMRRTREHDAVTWLDVHAVFTAERADASALRP